MFNTKLIFVPIYQMEGYEIKFLISNIYIQSKFYFIAILFL